MKEKEKGCKLEVKPYFEYEESQVQSPVFSEKRFSGWRGCEAP